MSIRTVRSSGQGTVQAGITPCLDSSGGYPPFAQSGVRTNDSIDIVFNGNPPFYLTQTICQYNYTFPSCWCGMERTNLTTSTFKWNVSSLKYTLPHPGDMPPHEDLFIPNRSQAIIWIAIEQNRTPNAVMPYYSSPNFSYSATPYDRGPSSAAEISIKTLGLSGWAVFGLALLATMNIL